MISNEVKFNNLCTEAQSLDIDWHKVTENCPTIESKIAALESTVKNGVNESDNSFYRVMRLAEGNQPTTTTKESTVVRKNNGPSHNVLIIEGEKDALAGQRGTSENISEADPLETKENLATVKHIVESGKFTEDQARVIVGLPTSSVREVSYLDESNRPARKFVPNTRNVPDGLSEGQIEEYRFARSIGISEADALRLVKVTGGYGSNKAFAGRQ